MLNSTEASSEAAATSVGQTHTATMTLAEALRDALRLKVAEDPSVYLLGEDIGKLGGFFRVTAGLQSEFGEQRVIDTPLNETAILGAAIGMAIAGLRPVVEIQQMDFIYPASDQIINELAKLRFRSGGQFAAPVVIRAPYGGKVGGGLYHSQSCESMFLNVPGLKVVTPSGPADAKGLLVAALEDPDPVLFLEPKRFYSQRPEEVPLGIYRTPIGTARIVRSGADVTVVTYGPMVAVALAVAETLIAVGIDCEVIDLRSLNPWDEPLVFESVARTRRAAVLHEAPRTCGFGAELSARITEELFGTLKAPVARIAGFDTPYPFALEHLYDLSPERVARMIQRLCEERVAYQS
jgi:pyruvate dehydrogenase E1 component beta subunit